MVSSLSALLNRRPNTPFYYGWLVLGLSGAGAFVATAVAGVVLGGVQGYILEDTNWPRTSIGLASSCGRRQRSSPRDTATSTLAGGYWLRPCTLVDGAVGRAEDLS